MRDAPPQPAPPPRVVDAAALALAAVAAATAVVGRGASATLGSTGLELVTAAAPIAAGWWLVRVGGAVRLGVLVLVAALPVALLGLLDAPDGRASLLGALARGPALLAAYACLLAFPDGRLRGRPERLLVAAGAACVLVLDTPAALITATADLPGAHPACTVACPDNPSPLVVDGALGPALAVAGIIAAHLYGIGACLLASVRFWRASPLRRRTTGPTVALAALRTVGLGALVGVLATVGATRAATALGSAGGQIMLALFWLSMPFGILGHRLRVARALARLLRRLQDARAGEVDGLVRDALDDPTARMARLPDDAPEPRSGLTPVPGTGRALVHDAAWDGDPMAAAVGRAAAAALARIEEVERLAELGDQLRASRARTVEAAVDERRRIERDLHDGAQQRLVAARIRLGLALDLVRRDQPTAPAEVERARVELVQAIAALDDLAAGIHPARLRAAGLGPALAEAAARSAIPVELDVADVGRLPPAVEEHVWFCCLEALQNAAKHAGPGARCRLRLSCRDDELELVVEDDGVGLPTDGVPVGGTGLLGLRDRIESIGGRLELGRSPLGGLEVPGGDPARRRKPAGTVVRTGDSTVTCLHVRRTGAHGEESARTRP